MTPAPPLTILRGHKPMKDAVFASLAQIAGGARMLGLQPLGWPRGGPVVDEAMARAKRQHRGPLRHAKRALIAAQYAGAARYFARRGGIAVCWNGLTGSRRAFMEGARSAGAGRLYAELAPFAGYVTLDPEGLNGEASVPRNRSALGAPLSEARAEDLARGLTARAARHDRVGQGPGDLPDRPFWFVPLQVPGDSQLTVFGGWTGGMEGFVAALARAAATLPEGWHLRLKEHPSARTSLAATLDRARAEAGGRIVVDNATDTFAQVRAARGVVTVNSSVALQSFLLDRPVIATGRAFWAEPGLVTPAPDAEALADALAAPPAYDRDHRMALLRYLLDDYLVPFDGTALDPARTHAKLAEAAP